ncbi:YjbQ family protein [Candidatus Bathyarchaeota archaeon]|nr:MAG: YjbQ family protein [Candidatus Bathyarchaeota archaeon]
MKIYTKPVYVISEAPTHLVNITGEVYKALRESGVKSGLVHVYTTHTTTGLTINEDEPGLEQDIPLFLSKLVPEEGEYFHHHYYAKDGRLAVNAWAHIRASLMGNHLTIPVDDGKLIMGSRQKIYLVELDGPQRRRIVIQVIGE